MIHIQERDLQNDIVTSPEGIRGTFVEHQQELRWLAGFLTGDDNVGEACVVDACAFAQRSCTVDADWPAVSPALAVIFSAMQIQRSRIRELCSVYDGRISQPAEGPLPAGALELIVMESDVLRCRLDTICRFLLAICGFQGCTLTEAAAWLGISQSAAEAAYSAAVELIDALDLEKQLACDDGPAMWN